MDNVFSLFLDFWFCLSLFKSSDFRNQQRQEGEKFKWKLNKLKVVSMEGGGVFRTSAKRGVTSDSTNMDKGREGVKNPEKFADVLYGWPLINLILDLD